jgi:hypothetical protein
MLETVLGLWILDGRLSPWRIGAVLHCCKSAKLFYQASRKQLTSSTAVGAECGMVAADGSGWAKPKYGCKKQIEHFNVTARNVRDSSEERLGSRAPVFRRCTAHLPGKVDSPQIG